jgi:hypothetical protein
MKTRTLGFLLVAVLAAAIVSFAADDAEMGTWKLNEAKSHLAPGMGKNLTVTYEMAGDSIKSTIDGEDASGKPTHSEWTGKFDGKEYPVTGDATSDMRSYKRVDAHTMTVTAKKGDKVTLTARIVVSTDGKTRTVTATIMNAKGEKVKSVGVYEKQ